METFKELSKRAPEGHEFTLKTISKEGLENLNDYWRYNKKVIDAKREMVIFKPVNRHNYEITRTDKNHYIHFRNTSLAYLLRHNFIRKIDTNSSNKLNISILDTVIHKNIFVHRDNRYRLTGYVFIYELSDGSLEFACCDVTRANGVTGYGTAGVVAYINDIEFIEEVTTWTDSELYKKKAKFESHTYSEDSKCYFLRNLVPGLSRTEYDEIYIEHLLKQLDNSHFRH